MRIAPSTFHRCAFSVRQAPVFSLVCCGELGFHTMDASSEKAPHTQ